MPRGQHVATAPVVTYSAHRHAGHNRDAASSGTPSPATPGSTVAASGRRQRVWTWKPDPDPDASLHRP